MTDTLTTLAYQWQWFKPTMTHAEVKKLRKLLARQYHPDIAKDGGATMRDINAELERWEQLYGPDAPPVVKLPPGAEHWTPDQWWLNIKNAAQQRNAHVAQNPPPVQPQPAAQPTVPPPPPPVQPQPRPARPSSASTTRQRRTNARIDTDFSNALSAPVALDGTQTSGNVTILWADANKWVVACEVKGNRPCHQIRVNGTVVQETPATTHWRAERKVIIDAAKNWHV